MGAVATLALVTLPATSAIEQFVQVPFQVPTGLKRVHDITFAPNGSVGGVQALLGAWGETPMLNLSCHASGLIRWVCGWDMADALLLRDGQFLRLDTRAAGGYEPTTDVELTLIFLDDQDRRWCAKAAVTPIGLVKFNHCMPLRPL
jgi:hypothetical protein